MILSNNKLLTKFRQSRLLPVLKQDKAQKFTSVVLTFTALSIFGLFAINPTIATIANLRRELDDNRYTQAQLAIKINNLSTLGGRYQEIQNDIPVVLNAIPQDPQVSILAGQLQSLIKSSGAILSGLQTYEVEITTPKTSTKKFSSFAFSISAEGNYEDIMKLIDNISSMQRVVSLDLITINRKTDATQTIQLSLRGNAYFKN